MENTMKEVSKETFWNVIRSLPGFGKYRVHSYPTKEGARLAAIQYGLKLFSRKPLTGNKQKVIDALIAAKIPQLKLF